MLKQIIRALLLNVIYTAVFILPTAEDKLCRAQREEALQRRISQHLSHSLSHKRVCLLIHTIEFYLQRLLSRHVSRSFLASLTKKQSLKK